MKKHMPQRILAFGLFVLLMMQAMPVLATGSGTFSLETREMENGKFYFQAADVDFGESHLYYDQLSNDTLRAAYHEMAGLTPMNNVLEMTVTDIPVWNIPDEGFTQEFLTPIYAYIADILLPAYAAVSLDMPQLFWATSVQYGGSVSHDGVKVTALHLQCVLTSAPQFDSAEYTRALLDLDQKLASLPFDDSQGRYSLLKQFHDYLCETVVYIDSTNAHNIIGPLLEGESVCEGYAKSFKLFCDLYEIPCMVVTGVGVTASGTEAHAWNVVRMEDGKWYGVDVTWDDQTSRIYYEFFLVGGDTVPDHYQALSFNQSHVVENDFYQNGLVVLASPTLSSSAYVPEEEHQHQYTVSVTPPTCEEDGYTTYTCTCGYSYTTDITQFLGHSYQAIITNPTCTENGYVTYTCSRCGDSYVGNELQSTGHYYQAVVTDPTCTEGGYTTYTCHCGDSYVADETDPLGHDYEAMVTDPFCEEGGYTTYTCSRCGDSYVADETDPLGHDYKEEVTEPTCTAGGYTIFVCTRCGYSYIGDETQPLGHDYEAVVTEPTCTAGGYTTYTCHCGYSYVADETQPLDHDFGEWALTEPGVESRTCNRCGEAESREAPPAFDQDGDGQITESDAELLLELLVSGKKEDLRCDLDFDGKFTIYDCVLLLQQIG